MWHVRGGERKPEGKKDHLVDKAVDGKIILKWMFKAYDMGGVDWIDLTQDRDKWRALVNTAMNPQVP